MNGRLAFETGRPGRWVVADLQPHVAIMFKRLFPRVEQAKTELTLVDNDEIRADLEWFTSRYPLKTEHAGLLAEGRERIERQRADRERILLPDWEPTDLIGFRSGMKPYRYQAQAAQIAVNNGGLLLGDDVGLGKTITTFATAVFGAPLPMAIVVQPHLADQWKKRAEEFTHMRVHIINGRAPYNLPEADLYIFRYSNIAGWVDVFAQGVFKSVVWDEIQELRHGAATAKGAASLTLRDNARFRLGLTATPIYNFGDEMHAVADFIRPGLLGDIYEFRREWCSWGKAVKDPDALGAYLRSTGYFLRRREDDKAVDAALPPPNVLDYPVAFDQQDVEREEEIIKSLAMTVLKGAFTEAGAAARQLDLRMRQLTGIGKARSVAAYVKMLLRDSERVLLTGWHREVYSIWQKALSEFNPVLFTGTESTAGKKRSMDAFTNGDSRVMMISLRSGAGLDGLQHHCNDIVFGELDWSPQVHHQLIGRLRRPGQKRQVNAYYLHADGGSDPVLMEMLGMKADQSRGINDPGMAMVARHSDDSRIKKLAEYIMKGEVAHA
ncbi:ATP-dependent helicase [Altererythrobacter indicus]|uniref:ATP-dependent helicase n=1 Tax=Altericroceibacterium indicum TaxID=374177 RepID=A0A845AC84_9SPHN|nr:DEAD/DEAH box helicase [Altericroceibacterium indicum]MXP24788.1 ATP-dependent helicase [Altericroceibacterium indicum]